MLEFCVDNQIVSRKDEFRVVADSKNYLKAHFVMTEEWTSDTAILFGYGGEFFCMMLDENSCCMVPFEVIKPPFFTVSLFCGEDTLVTANTVTVYVEKSGVAEGKTPEIPTPDIWQQYLSQMQTAVSNGIPHIGENRNWYLYNPETGQYEDSCVCAEGNTPEKYIDYWTETDKAEMVNEVLAALPNADTMSFPLEKAVSEVSEDE